VVEDKRKGESVYEPQKSKVNKITGSPTIMRL